MEVCFRTLSFSDLFSPIAPNQRKDVPAALRTLIPTSGLSCFVRNPFSYTYSAHILQNPDLGEFRRPICSSLCQHPPAPPTAHPVPQAACSRAIPCRTARERSGKRIAFLLSRCIFFGSSATSNFHDWSAGDAQTRRGDFIREILSLLRPSPFTTRLAPS